MLDAVGWGRIRIVVGDEDGRELVKQRLDLGRPGTVKTTKMWGRPVCLVGGDNGERGQQGTVAVRKTKETTSLKVDQEAVIREEVCAEDRSLNLGKVKQL